MLWKQGDRAQRTLRIGRLCVCLCTGGDRLGRMKAYDAHASFGPQPVPDGVKPVTVPSPAGDLSGLWAQPPEGQAVRGTVLMIPGFTGSKEDFLQIMPVLAERGWRILAYSQRGQADSAAPDGVDAYRLEDFASDAEHIARDLAERTGENIHLLGHSFGGVVARQTVLRAPELFVSLTLFSTGSHSMPPDSDRQAQFDQLERIAADRAQRDVRPGYDDQPLADLRDELVRQRAFATSLDNLVGIARILADYPDRTAELAALDLPVHVVYGSDDEAWPLDWYIDEAEALAARRSVIPDAAHSAQIENPPAFADAVTAFWADSEPGSDSA